MADANLEASRKDPKFYVTFHNGEVAGDDALGLPAGCGPEFPPAFYKDLDTYGVSEQPDSSPESSLMQQCFDVSFSYAENYNRRLATLRPDLLQAACEPAGTKH